MYLNSQWTSFLDEVLTSKNFYNLESFITQEYNKKIIYPEYNNIFRTFNFIAPEEVKVVILGQDPYHGKNQANGLAFSVTNGLKLPPSLKNIFNELVSDIGCKYPIHSDLKNWVENGVLLLNSVLTVEEGLANSHKNIGWEFLTDSVINKLSLQFNNIVFILWGSYAQKKNKLIDSSKHLIIESPHPSPLSSYRGFFGSKPFSKANNYLISVGKQQVNWCL